MWYLSISLIFLSIFPVVAIIDLKAANHASLRLSFLLHLFLFLFWSYRGAILVFVPLFCRLRIIKGSARTEFVGWGRWERGLLVSYLALLENVRSDWLHYYISFIVFRSVLSSRSLLRRLPFISIGNSILLIIIIFFILDPRRTILITFLCLDIKLELFLMFFSDLHLFFFFQYIFSCSVFIGFQRVISLFIVVAQLDFSKDKLFLLSEFDWVAMRHFHYLAQSLGHSQSPLFKGG